jgi:hypothetical protein
MFTSYCSRLHNVNTKRDKRTAKKSVKVQVVLEDDTLIISPYTLEFINNNKISLQTPNNASMLTFAFIKNTLVLSSHATLKGTHSSPSAIHNERLLYQ